MLYIDKLVEEMKAKNIPVNIKKRQPIDKTNHKIMKTRYKIYTDRRK